MTEEIVRLCGKYLICIAKPDRKLIDQFLKLAELHFASDSCEYKNILRFHEYVHSHVVDKKLSEISREETKEITDIMIDLTASSHVCGFILYNFIYPEGFELYTVQSVIKESKIVELTKRNLFLRRWIEEHPEAKKEDVPKSEEKKEEVPKHVEPVRMRELPESDSESDPDIDIEFDIKQLKDELRKSNEKISALESKVNDLFKAFSERPLL